MTRIFDSNGNHIPVTVVKLIPNVVSQLKTLAKDGYSAYQFAYNEKKSKLIRKPILGHLKKANIDKSFAEFFEVRVDSDVEESALGSSINYEYFKTIDFVDVTAVSKGKGFQGVMKRHGFQGGPAAHGSHFHRRSGSIGNRATPARVFPEKKMPGQMGNKVITVQNLKVININTEKGYMLIKGALPGGTKGFVRVTKALKK